MSPQVIYQVVLLLSYQNISESVGNVPVHVGARDLKQLSFVTIGPKFAVWSKNYPLLLDGVILRSKNWVEIIPKFSGQDDDVDAIKDHFYRPRGRAKTVSFNAGSGIEVYLEIEHEKYLEILERKEEQEQVILILSEWSCLLTKQTIIAADYI